MTRSSCRSSSDRTSLAWPGLTPAAIRRGVGRRVPHVPPPGPADVAVRSRPDAPPVAVRPVQQVVRAARRGGGRPVGDLVPAESGRAEGLVRGQVAVGEDVIVGRGELAAPDPRRQPGARLDGERVRGHMVRPGRDRRVQRAPPVRGGFPRRPVDQVQAHVLEAGRRGPRRRTAPDGRAGAPGPGPPARRAPRSACRTRYVSRPGTRSSWRLASSTLSGFASVVTSAPGARPNSASMARRMRPSADGGSRVGVPPPKNTVLTVTSAPARTWRANLSSAIARSG